MGFGIGATRTSRPRRKPAIIAASSRAGLMTRPVMKFVVTISWWCVWSIERPIISTLSRAVSAEVARDKIEKISRSIDETHGQLVVTTNYVTSRIINPAREIAAIMAGVRRGLEVLLAPAPKQINESYAEEEMFIG